MRVGTFGSDSTLSKGRVGEQRAAVHHERNFADNSVQITQPTRDGGVDFIYEKDGTTIYGEAKNLERPACKPQVRQAVEEAKKRGGEPAFHSESGYTGPAHEIIEEFEVRATNGSDYDFSDAIYRYIKSGKSIARNYTTKAITQLKARLTWQHILLVIAIFAVYALYKRKVRKDTEQSVGEMVVQSGIYDKTIERYKNARERYSESVVSNYVPWSVILCLSILVGASVVSTATVKIGKSTK